MTATPRATPVARVPLQSPPASERVRRNHLRAPITVVSTRGEWELTCGALIIGRDSEANVVVDDPLVSRFHARLLVGRDGQVTLEDLQSANGIFVNGIKLSDVSTLLEEGDRLLLGTTEFSVFALRPSTMMEHEQHALRLPPSTPSAAQASEMPAASDEPKRYPRRQVVVTGRSDPIDLVGQFAEKLMSSGHPHEAARVLSEHLQNLLKGASAGLTVPEILLEKATRYALRLKSWTQRTEWVEYVFELHLACLQVPSDAILHELEPVVTATADLDASLIGYFVRTLERRHDALTPEESQRLRRIECLGGPRSSRFPPPNAG